MWPGFRFGPAKGTLAVVAASSPRATGSPGSSFWTCLLPHTRAAACRTGLTIVTVVFRGPCLRNHGKVIRRYCHSTSGLLFFQAGTAVRANPAVLPGPSDRLSDCVAAVFFVRELSATISVRLTEFPVTQTRRRNEFYSGLSARQPLVFNAA
jgi:hypothetical protein